MKRITRKILPALIPLIWTLMAACSSGGNNNPPKPQIPPDANNSDVQAALASTQAALQECEQQAAASQNMILSAATALSQPGATVTSGILPTALTSTTAGVTPTSGTLTSGSCQNDATTAILNLLAVHGNSGQLAINTPGFIPYLQALFTNMLNSAGTGLTTPQQAQLLAAGTQLFQQIVASLPPGTQSQIGAYVPGATGPLGTAGLLGATGGSVAGTTVAGTTTINGTVVSTVPNTGATTGNVAAPYYPGGVVYPGYGATGYSYAGTGTSAEQVRPGTAQSTSATKSSTPALTVKSETLAGGTINLVY